MKHIVIIDDSTKSGAGKSQNTPSHTREEILKADESPYNREFVKKIKRSLKQPGVKIDLDDLWK
ncbi:MAG: DUF2683 family protein [Mangrovibacterium sp.]